MVNRRPRLLALAAGAALVLAMLLSVSVGAVDLTLAQLLHALGAGLHGELLAGTDALLWQLRLPRVLMAAVVGASLGAAGAGLQGLFRNPLADPYLLGVASGAGLGATVAFVLGLAALAGGVPLLAALGAAAAVLLTLAVAHTGRGRDPTALVLAGVVVSSVLTAATSLLMLARADQLRAVVAWTLGNLGGAGWHELGAAALGLLVGFAVLWSVGRDLDALQLGDTTARSLGVRSQRVQWLVVLGASVATATAVAGAGLIGFIGLVAPHLCRRLGVPQHRWLVPTSALTGALLLVLADLGARLLWRPAELPVGVLTTLLGGPFFLALLRRRAR